MRIASGLWHAAMLLCLISERALAAHANDGIFHCATSINGPGNWLLMAVNSSGETGVITFPYLGGDQLWDGYLIGQWAGNVLNGTTNTGGLARAAFSPSGISATIQINDGAQIISVDLSCQRVI